MTTGPRTTGLDARWLWLRDAVVALYGAMDRDAAPVSLCLVTAARRDVVAYTAGAARPAGQVDRRLVTDLAAVQRASRAATVNITPDVPLEAG